MNCIYLWWKGDTDWNKVAIYIYLVLSTWLGIYSLDTKLFSYSLCNHQWSSYQLPCCTNLAKFRPVQCRFVQFWSIFHRHGQPVTKLRQCYVKLEQKNYWKVDIENYLTYYVPYNRQQPVKLHSKILKTTYDKKYYFSESFWVTGPVPVQ